MMQLVMKLVAVVRIGVQMRAAQARYFKAVRGSDEKSAALRESVALERRFDALAAEALRHADAQRLPS
jgi:hypothetical protein